MPAIRGFQQFERCVRQNSISGICSCFVVPGSCSASKRFDLSTDLREYIHIRKDFSTLGSWRKDTHSHSACAGFRAGRQANGRSSWRDLSSTVIRRCGRISIFYMPSVRDTSFASYTASIGAYRPVERVAPQCSGWAATRCGNIRVNNDQGAPAPNPGSRFSDRDVARCQQWISPPHAFPVSSRRDSLSFLPLCCRGFLR